MKAVRIYAYGGPDVLKYELDAPEPTLEAGSVLVDCVATSVNPIDWKVRSGSRQKDFPLVLPAILGKDVSGGRAGSRQRRARFQTRRLGAGARRRHLRRAGGGAGRSTRRIYPTAWTWPTQRRFRWCV